MKAISFLGSPRGGYQETVYRNPGGGPGLKTAFFQEALVEFYRPATLYVLLTKKAETDKPQNATEATWLTLQKRLAGKVDLQPITNVPETHSQADVWQLFEKLTSCLQEGDHVLFDITLGFRSLPVLALLAVSYLRVVRRVTIEGLIYGAFEAPDPVTKETPIFDLLPIVSLLEWTTATDQFLKAGNAEALAKLLPPDGPTGPLAASITGIAQGLHLLRPMDVMQEAAALPGRIDAAVPTISKDVPPFASLIQRVREDYGGFGLENPTDPAHGKQSLLRHLRMVEWYADKSQFVHALSLAREWLPSLLCWHFKLDPMEKTNRDDMEWLLSRGGSDKDPVTHAIIKESPHREAWRILPGGKRLARLWGDPGNLAKLRNDALHSGFRRDPSSAQEIAGITTGIISELKAIAAEWKLRE